MKPRHLAVQRTARYFAVGPEPPDAREIWIVLHGYAQLAEKFLTQFAPLDDGHTHIVAPEALSRFYLETERTGRHSPLIGATWLTREDRAADLQDHLAYLDRVFELAADPAVATPVTVLGFSQGAVMAARWVAQGKHRPDHTVLWGSPLPEDVPAARLAEALQGHSLSLVAGHADPIVPAGVIEAAADTLRAAGVPAQAVRFQGGHQIPRAALLGIARRQA